MAFQFILTISFEKRARKLPKRKREREEKERERKKLGRNTVCLNEFQKGEGDKSWMKGNILGKKERNAPHLEENNWLRPFKWWRPSIHPSSEREKERTGSSIKNEWEREREKRQSDINNWSEARNKVRNFELAMKRDRRKDWSWTAMNFPSHRFIHSHSLSIPSHSLSIHFYIVSFPVHFIPKSHIHSETIPILSKFLLLAKSTLFSLVISIIFGSNVLFTLSKQ